MRIYLPRELFEGKSNNHPDPNLQHRHSPTLPRGELEGGLVPLVGYVFQLFRNRELLVGAFANLKERKQFPNNPAGQSAGKVGGTGWLDFEAGDFLTHFLTTKSKVVGFNPNPRHIRADLVNLLGGRTLRQLRQALNPVDRAPPLRRP